MSAILDDTGARLRAEAERQAREGMRPGSFKTHCTDCKRPFTFGTLDSDANVYSMAGARDTQIVGICESCFDGLFDKEDDL